MRHGAGALRRLDEESLAEINEIFKVSGGSEMFDSIERHSDRKAVNWATRRAPTSST